MRPDRRPTAPLDPARARRLREELLAWWDGSRRTLPWRAPPGAAADPWAVLVSEVMLQQTTVATVARRFAPFLARFPDPAALAEAPLDEVLHAWQGLGYYRRARALHACARMIVADHDGRVPAEPELLGRLPGLGAYSAAAVAAIAFGRPVLPVDGNVARVGARLFALALPPAAARAEVPALLGPLAAGPRPGDLAQAVMELGALVCRPRAPACALCPWRGECGAAALGRPEDFPARAPRRVRQHQAAVAFLLRRPDGAVLLRRRPEGAILGGLMELPSTPWGPEQPLEDCLKHAPAAGPWEPVEGRVRHVFTHLELTVRLLRAEAREAVEGSWLTPASLAEAALPSLTRKLLRHGGIEPPPLVR